MITIPDWDAEADVVVVGAGGCGLVAALAAQEQGADVIVLEKQAKPGGNTSLSGGSIPGAGTRFQRAEGIVDSPQKMAADLLSQSGLWDDRFMTDLLAGESAGLVEWLSDSVGVSLRLITFYRHVGHTVHRLHGPRSRRGADLVAELLREIDKRDIGLAVDSPVAQLIDSERGTIDGVEVSHSDGSREYIRAKAVVLACNGFGGNRDMLRAFAPDVAEAPYFGNLGNTGEGIRWGMDRGARVANMAAYQAHAAVLYPQGDLLTWTVVEKGGIIVNNSGSRFADESLGYSGFATHMFNQPDGQGVVLWDSAVDNYVAKYEEPYKYLRDRGAIQTYASAADIAARFGVDGEVLARTIDRYNGCAAGHGDDQWGRREFALAPLSPPFVAARVTGGLFHTQGGVVVDEKARVRFAAGGVIPNLYAGGGVTAGVSGSRGGGGYCSGNGLLSALGLGRIAGREAARALRT